VFFSIDCGASLPQLEPDRTMIGAHHVWSNKRRVYSTTKAARNEMIVDAPTRIPRPRSKKVGPPGIRFCLIRIDMTECVDKPRVYKCLESCALFICKAVSPSILGGIFEVDFLVSHVEISTENHGLSLLEITHGIEKCRVPPTSIRKPR
jgi:hypothetical protein